MKPGQRFGRLTAWQKLSTRYWMFSCDCGSPPKTISRYDVERGSVKSCGCLLREVTAARNKSSATKGGITNTPTGRIWRGMLVRCYNKNHHSYKHYGAKGIAVCEFLRASPANLVQLLGQRPSKMEIDRIDNCTSYTCGCCKECLSNGWKLNVRWVTKTQQNRNQKRNHRVTINGKTMCVAEWAEIIGINESSFRGRLQARWPENKLLSPKKQ